MDNQQILHKTGAVLVRVGHVMLVEGIGEYEKVQGAKTSAPFNR